VPKVTCNGSTRLAVRMAVTTALFKTFAPFFEHLDVAAQTVPIARRWAGEQQSMAFIAPYQKGAFRPAVSA
jgi:hypothetical protein